MKIDKATFALLPALLQASFKPNPANAEEYDNGEEAVDGLKSALQKEKDEAANIKKKLSEFESAKLVEIEAARKKALEEARSTGDFAKIEKDYQERIKALEDANKKAAAEREASIRNEAVEKHVDELAKLFVSPSLAKPFIKSRLTAELVDGSPIVRVLGKDGKPSAASFKDLEKEYLTDSELKSSLIASKGSGGGSGLPTTGGGSGVVDDANKFDAASADPKSMIARLEAKGLTVDGEDD
jgi:hypothetical protein